MLRWERVNDDEDDSIKGEYRDIHISDIKGDLMKMSLGELKCLKEKCLVRERSSDVDYIAGVPSTYLAFFFHSEYRMMFERHCLYQLIYENELNIDSEEKVMAAFFEVLSKALVYREPKIGTVIFAYGSVAYNVVQVCVTGKGCAAYLLKLIGNYRLNEHVPQYILVFSGSKLNPSGLDCCSYWGNDLAREIGQEAFESGHCYFEQLKDEFSGTSGKILVCGHSIGGKNAQDFTAKYPELVCKLITFAAPGVTEHTHKLLDFYESTHPSIPIESHVVSGDFVPTVGGYHLGAKRSKHVANFKFFVYTIHKSFYFKGHTYLCLSNPQNLNVTVACVDSKCALVLYNSHLENLRYLMSFINQPLLRGFRYAARSIVQSRVDTEYKTHDLLNVWME